MKRILPIVLAVVMILSTCLFAGCDKKDQQPETYDMSLLVNCGANKDLSYVDDATYTVFHIGVDLITVEISMMGQYPPGENRYFRVSHARVDGFEYFKDYCRMNDWNAVTLFYEVSGICRHYYYGTFWQEIPVGEDGSFCIDQVGYYQMTWTVTPIDDDLQKINPRTIQLDVYVR